MGGVRAGGGAQGSAGRDVRRQRRLRRVPRVRRRRVPPNAERHRLLRRPRRVQERSLPDRRPETVGDIGAAVHDGVGERAGAGNAVQHRIDEPVLRGCQNRRAACSGGRDGVAWHGMRELCHGLPGNVVHLDHGDGKRYLGEERQALQSHKEAEAHRLRPVVGRVTGEHAAQLAPWLSRWRPVPDGAQLATPGGVSPPVRSHGASAMRVPPRADRRGGGGRARAGGDARCLGTVLAARGVESDPGPARRRGRTGVGIQRPGRPNRLRARR